MQLEKEEKAKIEQITQERSKQAFEKQKKMDDDRYQAVHQYLERRKQVLETENSLYNILKLILSSGLISKLSNIEKQIPEF